MFKHREDQYVVVNWEQQHAAWCLQSICVRGFLFDGSVGNSDFSFLQNLNIFLSFSENIFVCEVMTIKWYFIIF